MKLLTIIGEASGDLHGANVLREIKKINPAMKIIGTGGNLFKTVADQTYHSIEEMEVIGLFEVLKHWKKLKRIFQRMVNLLDSESPDAVFLVDYVGFNLRFAEQAKKKNIPVYFYISPQIWAWKKNRIQKIRDYVDKLIVLFPFEVKYFADRNVQVECFGHPLLDIVKTNTNQKSCFQKWGLSSSKKLVSLLPGSRHQEIKKHLPILLKTIPLISKAYKNTQFVCITPSKKSSTIAQKILSSQKLKIPLICEDAYNLIGNSDLALTASGTVTLETAILKTPMIIFYKINFLSYLLFRYIFNVQIIGLPNIVMKEKFVPELLSNSLTPEKIAQKSIEILEKKAVFEKMKKKFSHLKNKLGTKGAYKNTAKYLHKQFKQFHKI